MDTIRRHLPLFAVLPVLALAACATTQDLEQHADRLGATVQRLGDSQQALGQQFRQLEASHGARLGKLDDDVRQLGQQYQTLGRKVDAHHDEFLRSRLEGKLVKQVFLNEDRVLYPANALELPPGDTQALDQLAKELRSSNAAYHIEIQGHTDDIGNADFNQFLGEGRAQAVRDYLYREGGIPLYRMSTISYGALLPAAKDPGSTANRRVKLLVYR